MRPSVRLVRPGIFNLQLFHPSAVALYDFGNEYIFNFQFVLFSKFEGCNIQLRFFCWSLKRRDIFLAPRFLELFDPRSANRGEIKENKFLEKTELLMLHPTRMQYLFYILENKGDLIITCIHDVLISLKIKKQLVPLYLIYYESSNYKITHIRYHNNNVRCFWQTDLCQN